MSEVIIELDLKRRSGVLAGAVAALRNLSLDFKTQQIVDHEGQPRLILTTEGQVADLAEVTEAYAQARGVHGLADVRVDGVSLVYLPEPEPELASEVSPAPDERASEVVSDPVSVPFSDPVSDTLSEPESAASEVNELSSKAPVSHDISPDQDVQEKDVPFNDDAFASHALVEPEHQAPADRSLPDEPESSSVSETGESDTKMESGAALKPSMVRRRRRRR